MANGAVLCFLSVLGICAKGLTVAIQTQQTVLAAVGEEAHLSCELLQPKDVRQVTWQKISPEGERDLASSNKYFGQRVKSGFTDKVEFKDADLQNCSIVIRKVTEQDVGCYRCLFNIYPEGALTARTCLQLYELHEPVLHVGESDSTDGLVVSCRVTGRPDPAVTLNVTQQDLLFSNHSTVSVSNANGTVTVTATAVLTGYRKNGTQVGCAGRVLSGCQREAFVTVPELRQASKDGFSKNHKAGAREFKYSLIVVLVALVFCACFSVAVAFQLKPKDNSSADYVPPKDPERSITPKKPIKAQHKVETPLIKQQNEMRERTSTKKRPPDNDLKPSPSLEIVER